MQSSSALLVFSAMIYIVRRRSTDGAWIVRLEHREVTHAIASAPDASPMSCIASTDARVGAILQEDLKLSMGKSLQLHDPFNVDDGVAMYTEKANRVEALLQIS